MSTDQVDNDAGSRPSRVGIFATPLGSNGGVSRWIRETSSLLTMLGCEVQVLVGVKPQSNVAPPTDTTTVFNVSSWNPFGQSLTLRRWVKSNQINLLVTALPQAAVIASASQLAVPVLVSLHGHPPTGIRGTLYTRYLARLEGRLRILAVSEGTKRAWQLSQAAVVPNSVQLAGPSDSGRQRGSIAFVGRLEPEKGLDFLLDCISAHPQFEFTIAGDGSLRRHIERFCESHSNAKYVGWSDRPDLINQSHEFCIFPAPNEGMPYSLLDSIAFGSLPLVRSRDLAIDVGLTHDQTMKQAQDLERVIESMRSAAPSSLVRNNTTENALELWSGEMARATPSNPNILFIGHSAQLSGGEIGMMVLARNLDATRTRIALFEPGPITDQIIGSGLALDTDLHGLLRSDSRRGDGFVHLLAELTSWVGAAKRLHSYLKKQSPDVVVGASIKASLLLQFCSPWLNPTVVHLIREPLCSPNFNRGTAALLSWILAPRSLQIANSGPTASTLRGNVRIVPPPVEPHLDHKGCRHFSDADRSHGKTVLLLGTISEAKGQLDAVRTLAELLRSDKIHLRIVGRPAFKGDAEAYNELLRFIEQNDLSDNIDVCDWTDSPLDEVCDSDVVLISTTIQEGFSQVAAQGLLLGKPVVVPDNAGIVPWLTGDLQAGLFRWDEPASLPIALESALRPEVRRKFQQMGPKVVAQTAPDAVASSFLAIVIDRLSEEHARD